MMPLFDLRRVSEVIRTDATIPSKKYFLATHTPFRNLQFVKSGVSDINPKKLDEEQFFTDEILENNNAHYFLVVQGDNGSGKSHFIRWLKEKYESQANQENEAILFIARSQNTLRGTLEQILASNVFPPEFKREKLRGLIEANQHLSDAALQQNIVVQFALAADNAYREHSIQGLEERYARRIYEFLVDRTVQDQLCKKRGPIDRIKSKLIADDPKTRQDAEPRFLPEDFEFDYLNLLNKMRKDGASRHATSLGESLMDSQRGPELRKQLAAFLNQYLENVVQNCTNLRSADLKNIFEDLRRELKKVGKNLTLFIEDITSFTGIDRALMEVLITEHTGSNHNKQFCRLFSVVGVTTWYYNTDIPYNIRDRVKGRVLIDQAALTNPDEVSEMAARYINAILVDEEQMEVWSQAGAHDIDLPIFQLDELLEWATYYLPDGRQLPLFPFNKNALNKIYSLLPEKTPRRLLLDVLSHVLKLYIARKPNQDFPPRYSEFRGEFDIPIWQDNAYEAVVSREAGINKDRMAVLLRVWGDATAIKTVVDNKTFIGGISEEVFTAFDLKIIQGVDINVGKSTLRSNQPVATPRPTETNIKSQQVNEKFLALQRELEAWLEGGKLRTYQNLRDDIRNLLLDFIDWEIEGVSGVYGRAFFSTDRISIEDQIGKYNPGVQVKRNQESHNALLALCAWRILGDQSWDFDGSVVYLTQLHNWLWRIKDEVISAVVNSPKRDNEQYWDIPRWALINEVYIQIFNGRLQPSKTSTAEIYDQIMRPNEEIIIQENRSSAWNELQNRIKKLNKNTEKHKVISKLYNRMQVQINRDTDVYFIDAVELLKLLDDFKNHNWALGDINFTVDGITGNTVWEQILNLFLVLKDKASSAVFEENEWVKKQLDILHEYLENPENEKETVAVLDIINKFLLNTLPDANEPYNQSDFSLILDKNKPSNKALGRAIKTLIATLETTDSLDKMARLSTHPVASVIPYLQLFRKIDSLVDAKKSKFEMKNQQLHEENDVEKLRNEAIELIKTISAIKAIGGGGI